MEEKDAGKRPVPEELVRQFLRALVRFQRLMMEENRRPMRLPEERGDGCPPNRVKHGEMMILFAVQEAGGGAAGVTVGDLSRLMRVKPPSITAPLNTLEQKGVVRREQDREDRRVVRIYVTDKGNALVMRLKEAFHARMRGLLDYMGAEKAAQMLSLMEEMYQYFKSKRNEQPDEHETL